MLKVSHPSQLVIDQHLECVGKRFDEKMASWPIDMPGLPPYAQRLRDYLESHRDEILVGDAAQLRQIVVDIDTQFPLFATYTQNRPAAKDIDTEGLIEILEEVFNYTNFRTKHSGWDAYKLVGAYKLRICPYCQLHHVNYHSGGTPTALELRPPLDHYLPRSAYPYLAVSIGNLIPCCHQCNSSIKGDRVPHRGMPHPLVDNPKVEVNFGAKLTRTGHRTISANDVEVILTAAGGSADFLAFFHLQERYGWYTHEIADVFRKLEAWYEQHTTLASLPHALEYALQFRESDAGGRALGICLLELARKGLPTVP